MTRRQFFVGLAIAGAIAIGGDAAAQQPAPQVPTTVQLPTFSFFTVQTTVSVPDRGGAFLGGINRGRDGRVARGFGPLQNVATGGDRLASGASVHARIIDTEEIDRMLLAAAAKRSGTPIDPALAKASELTKHVGVAVDRAANHSPGGDGLWSAAPPTATLPDSLAAIRAQNAAAAEHRTSEAAGFFALAAAAEAEGKPAVAKIYYQMVVRRDAGPLKQQAQARLAALAKPPALASQ